MSTASSEPPAGQANGALSWNQRDSLGWQVWRRVQSTGLVTERISRSSLASRAAILSDRTPLLTDIQRRWSLDDEPIISRFSLNLPLFWGRPFFFRARSLNADSALPVARFAKAPLPFPGESSFAPREVAEIVALTEVPVHRRLKDAGQAARAPLHFITSASPAGVSSDKAAAAPKVKDVLLTHGDVRLTASAAESQSRFSPLLASRKSPSLEVQRAPVFGERLNRWPMTLPLTHNLIRERPVVWSTSFQPLTESGNHVSRTHLPDIRRYTSTHPASEIIRNVKDVLLSHSDARLTASAAESQSRFSPLLASRKSPSLEVQRAPVFGERLDCWPMTLPLTHKLIHEKPIAWSTSFQRLTQSGMQVSRNHLPDVRPYTLGLAPLPITSAPAAFHIARHTLTVPRSLGRVVETTPVAASDPMQAMSGTMSSVNARGPVEPSSPARSAIQASADVITPARISLTATTADAGNIPMLVRMNFGHGASTSQPILRQSPLRSVPDSPAIYFIESSSVRPPQRAVGKEVSISGDRGRAVMRMEQPAAGISIASVTALEPASVHGDESNLQQPSASWDWIVPHAGLPQQLHSGPRVTVGESFGGPRASVRGTQSMPMLSRSSAGGFNGFRNSAPLTNTPLILRRVLPMMSLATTTTPHVMRLSAMSPVAPEQGVAFGGPTSNLVSSSAGSAHYDILHVQPMLGAPHFGPAGELSHRKLFANSDGLQHYNAGNSENLYAKNDSMVSRQVTNAGAWAASPGPTEPLPIPRLVQTAQISRHLRSNDTAFGKTLSRDFILPQPPKLYRAATTDPSAYTASESSLLAPVSVTGRNGSAGAVAGMPEVKASADKRSTSPPEMDLEALFDKVWDKIVRKLTTEQERRGTRWLSS